MEEMRAEMKKMNEEITKLKGNFNFNISIFSMIHNWLYNFNCDGFFISERFNAKDAEDEEEERRAAAESILNGNVS